MSNILQLFSMIFIFMIIVVSLGMGIIVFNNLDSALNQNVSVGGGNNLSTINNQTFGQINDGLVNGADTIGLSIIFGMVIFMFMNAYFFGDKYPKLFLLLDIGILVIVFIMSIYVAQTYDTLINSSDIFDVYGDDLPRSSGIILNLPLYITAIGLFIMILTYAGIRAGNKGSAEPNVLGY